MGIRGMNALIKKFSPDAEKLVDINNYRGSIFGIDCSILLYKFKYASKCENSHLVGLVNRVKYYISNGILPVFVFDGHPPDAKKNTIQKRHDNKEKLYVRIEELRVLEKDANNEEDKKALINEIDRLSSQIIRIKKSHITECKELLEKSGIPYCTAPDDAEKYCAFLQKNGLIDYTVTDDTDAITFGCDKIIKTSINKIIEIDTNKVLQNFGMTREMFVDFCILSGCDYCDTIASVGPVTSFNMIKQYKTIDNFIESTTIKPDNFNFNFQTARKIFSEFDYTVPEKFTLNSCNKKDLLKFLEDNNFKENVIVKFFKILI
jgi:flap endonuclease-1